MEIKYYSDSDGHIYVIRNYNGYYTYEFYDRHGKCDIYPNKFILNENTTFDKIKQAISSNDIETIIQLLSEKNDLYGDYNKLFKLAIIHNRTDIIKIFFDNEQFFKNLSFITLLKYSIQNNDLEIFTFIYKLFKPFIKSTNISLLKEAINYDKFDVVKFIIDDGLIDISLNNSSIIKYVFIQHFNKDIFLLLLNDNRINPNILLKFFNDVTSNLTYDYFNNIIISDEIFDAFINNKNVDLSINNSFILRYTLVNGYINKTKKIIDIKKLDISYNNYECVIQTLANGHYNSFDLIIKLYNLSYDISYEILYLSVVLGIYRYVEIIFSKCEIPQMYKDQSLLLSIKHNRYDIFIFLIKNGANPLNKYYLITECLYNNNSPSFVEYIAEINDFDLSFDNNKLFYKMFKNHSNNTKLLRKIVSNNFVCNSLPDLIVRKYIPVYKPKVLIYD